VSLLVSRDRQEAAKLARNVLWSSVASSLRNMVEPVHQAIEVERSSLSSLTSGILGYR